MDALTLVRERTAEQIAAARHPPKADGSMSFNFPVQAEASGAGPELRWAQCIPAGIDGLVTPELMAADQSPSPHQKGLMRR